MARSALMSMLRRACSLAQLSIKTGIPTHELLGMLQENTEKHLHVSRRRLLQGGLAMAGAIAATTWTRDSHRAVAQTAGTSPILIVGAGIAGLTAAYRLSQVRVRTDIIEATNRIGGRIRTLPKAAGTNIPVDLGGEFIDSSHQTLISLATEMGLRLVDLLEFQGQLQLVLYTVFLQGRRITIEQLANELTPVVNQIQKDLTAIGDTVSYKKSNDQAERLDNLSIAQYLSQVQASAFVSQLIRVAYTSEYGRDIEEQSSLNLLTLIGTEPGSVNVFGDSDERYQVEGGNEQIIQKLAEVVGRFSSIETGTALEAITIQSDGRYRVSLRSGQSSFERTYERILLTLPFSTLRDVQINVNLPPLKRFAINELGYGTNSKLITAYQSRIWRDLFRSTAYTFTDLGFQNSWEATPFNREIQGLVTFFNGGIDGLAMGSGTAENQAKRFVTQFNKVFPGAANLRTGSAVRAYWPGERYTKGSYSCYLLRQWTTIRGVEAERVGNLFFAGEHTSVGYQGYMEGGAETGERAAIEILEDLGLRAEAAALSSRRQSQSVRGRSRRVPGIGSSNNPSEVIFTQ
ncbi:MAG: flavin monoamine oxidase family protein [Actinomycetota bacterium]